MGGSGRLRFRVQYTNNNKNGTYAKASMILTGEEADTVGDRFFPGIWAEVKPVCSEKKNKPYSSVTS